MLGELIEWLEQQDGTKVVPYGFGKPISYRGYYEDVAFEPAQNVTFAFMLENAKAALGATFQGYKGGAYTMHEYTDCWIAEYGACEGDKIGPTIKALWLATAANPLKGWIFDKVSMGRGDERYICTPDGANATTVRNESTSDHRERLLWLIADAMAKESGNG